MLINFVTHNRGVKRGTFFTKAFLFASCKDEMISLFNKLFSYTSGYSSLRIAKYSTDGSGELFRLKEHNYALVSAGVRHEELCQPDLISWANEIFR